MRLSMSRQLSKAQIKSLIKVTKGHRKSLYKYSRSENLENKEIISAFLELSGYNIRIMDFKHIADKTGLHRDTVGRRVNEAEEEFLSLMRGFNIDPFTLIESLKDEEKPIDKTIYIHTEQQVLPHHIKLNKKEEDNDIQEDA